MEISVSTGLYYTKDYKEILDIISCTSCSNIELFLNQAFIDVDISELKREVDRRNLKVLSIHTPLEFIAFERRESEQYWIDKSIEIAKAFNAKTIVSHMVLEKYFDNKVKSLDELHKENIIKYQEVEGINITSENLPCFENGSFLGRINDFYEFVENNNINVTFDTTHCACNGAPIIETYNKFKKYIRNIHLSDFNNGIEHKVVGSGTLPLKELIHKLKEDNYNGTVTIELDFDNKKRNNILNNKEAIEAIQKSLDFINDNLKE